jgi:hypothetical protein
MRTFVRNLTQESISNRRRLEYLEDFTLGRSTDLEARGVALTEQFSVLHENFLVLAKQHDDLIDIMKQFNDQSFHQARTLDDLEVWSRSQQLAERARKATGYTPACDQDMPGSSHDTDRGWSLATPPSPSNTNAEAKSVLLRIRKPVRSPPTTGTGLPIPQDTDDETVLASLQPTKLSSTEKPYPIRQSRCKSVEALEEAATSGEQQVRKRNVPSSGKSLVGTAKKIRTDASE